ncbi:MAG: ribosomal protein S18-alanine N-acetyltransferase [Desulfobacterales bacterium]|jgi:ribosomal-protein-alanine N-acetyltransferase|nr:MAG: ribosomal protein S18-alanine N-acetyltransferase [Desulfobacterales bacterium]
MAERPLSRIREFKIEDIDEILDIEQQAFPKTSYSKEVFLNYAKNFADTFVVVEIGRNVVGYIIFDMGGHIHSTAVKPTYRRKGFGKMLFMHALKYAKTKLWLEVRSKNSPAIEFYKRLGMIIVGRIPNYYETDDALVMVFGQKENRSNLDS